MRLFAFASVAAVLVVSAVLAAQRNSSFPDAVKADPAHYKVESENDAVRVIRIKFGPGEKSAMHSHPANCAIFLNESTFKDTTSDGKTQNTVNKAGQVQCGDAGAHLPQNIGKTTAELVLMEFKNRQTYKK